MACGWYGVLLLQMIPALERRASRSHGHGKTKTKNFIERFR
jgi:hypothetical protein